MPRPGRKAKQERQKRAKMRKIGIRVHRPRKSDPEWKSDISPGFCVAWADGRV